MTKSNDTDKEKQDKQKEQKLTPEVSGFNPSAFVQEAKEELNKVVWPDRQKLIGESAAVVLMVALSAGIISLVDQLFGWLAKTIF